MLNIRIITATQMLEVVHIQGVDHEGVALRVTVGTHSGGSIHADALPRHYENAILNHPLSHDWRLGANIDGVRADIGLNLITRLHAKHSQGGVWQH